MDEVFVHKYKQQIAGCSTLRKQRAGESGQALLELAFLLPILCVLTVGITDLGRAASVTIAVNNAATAGVEYGAQNSTTAQDLTGMQNHATYDTSGNNLPGSITATASNGCLCDTQTDGNYSGVSCTYPVPVGTCSAILTNCATGRVVECVQVVTSLTYSPFVSFPGVPHSYTVNGHAVMRVRQ